MAYYKEKKRNTPIATLIKNYVNKKSGKVSAYSGDTLLGEGTHLRFIVDREKFMSRLG